MIYNFRFVKNYFMNSEADLYLKVLNNVSIVSVLEKVKEKNYDRSIVFLCVGNSKVWFDCFGPFVGSLLQRLGLQYYVYGNIKSNILTNNIKEYVNMIYRFHVKPYIIVLDSSISNAKDFDIVVKEEKTTCGAFSEKPFTVGDLKVSCLIPIAKIKNSSGYVEVLSMIKRIGFFLNYVFGDKND